MCVVPEHKGLRYDGYRAAFGTNPERIYNAQRIFAGQEWWRTQSISNPSPVREFPANRENNREFGRNYQF